MTARRKTKRLDVEMAREEGIHIGDIYMVKKEVWLEWCFRHCNDCLPFKAQPVVALHHTTGEYVMLAYPMYWWKAEELEVEGDTPRDTQV